MVRWNTGEAGRVPRRHETTERASASVGNGDLATGPPTPMSTESRDDDRRARFEALAMPHVGLLHRVARRRTRGVDDAADLVQETFLRAYRTFDSFEEGTNERAWLLTILNSISSNLFRALRRRPVRVSLDAPSEAIDRPAREIADPDATEEILENPRLSWEGSEAARCLARLPPRLRRAVELVDLEELTYEEAAAALGCPVGTVRSRLFRARRRLAEQLGDVARAAGYAVEDAG